MFVTKDLHRSQDTEKYEERVSKFNEEIVNKIINQ